MSDCLDDDDGEGETARLLAQLEPRAPDPADWRAFCTDLTARITGVPARDLAADPSHLAAVLGALLGVTPSSAHALLEADAESSAATRTRRRDAQHLLAALAVASPTPPSPPLVAAAGRVLDAAVAAGLTGPAAPAAAAPRVPACFAEVAAAAALGTISASATTASSSFSTASATNTSSSNTSSTSAANTSSDAADETACHREKARRHVREVRRLAAEAAAAGARPARRRRCADSGSSSDEVSEAQAVEALEAALARFDAAVAEQGWDAAAGAVLERHVETLDCRALEARTARAALAADAVECCAALHAALHPPGGSTDTDWAP